MSCQTHVSTPCNCPTTTTTTERIYSNPEPCEEIVLTGCVEYHGPYLPCLGISSGDNLSTIITKINDAVNLINPPPSTTTTSTTTLAPVTSTTTAALTTTTTVPVTTTTTLPYVAPGTYSIGEQVLGGRVGYILQPGDAGYDENAQHGFIVADYTAIYNDQAWGCSQNSIIGGADGTAIGTGEQNTIDIVAQCPGSLAGIVSGLVINGYSDWFLPSKDELNKLFINRTEIFGFGSEFYWSSSEASYNTAWGQNFTTGVQSTEFKIYTHAARAIRRF